jgi:ABC-type branched-subunit amino acid transport system ATPase component/ABC-type branched-subunit amino acid transport system permease subunit
MFERSFSPFGPRLAIIMAGLALAALPFVLHSDYALFLLTQSAVLYLVALGLNVLTGYAGITSIGHGALVAMGAYALGIATVDHGWPFWGGMAASAIFAGLCGLALALPAFRLSTWYFALITLGFGSVVSGLITELDWLTHGFSGVVGIPKPSMFGVPLEGRGLFWLIAGTGLGAFLVTRNLIASRFGRALLAIKESPLTATSVGVRSGAVKIGAFIYSAVLAGIGGAFYATNQGVITPDDFTIHFSIFFLLVIVLGGLGSLHGPLLGTAAFFLLPYLMTGLRELRLLIYAVGLLILMIVFPQGLAGLLALFARRRKRKPMRVPIAASTTGIPAVDGARLVIEGVSKRFGGVEALADVSLTVEPGAIRGIVGPNGSGKTTLLNVISGYYKPDSGGIRIDTTAADEVSPATLARQGVRRTFQTPKLIPHLSIIENVMFGAYAAERASLVAIAFGLPSARREARARRAEAMEFLRFVGLAQHEETPVGEATHGQQRLAEIARALVGKPRLLLLDEPAAGLSLTELDGLKRVIAAIAASGTTIVIVEHHLELIADLCALITVVDRGRVLRGGPPPEVFADPEVLATYMGRRAIAGENV